MKEGDVEKYLVQCVEAAGGEVRKVKWVGRRSAPDRRVMIPRTERPADTVGRNNNTVLLPRAFWVELKAPGKAATFPANAHERAQKREHDKLRKYGDVVCVIDSIEGVDALFR